MSTVEEELRKLNRDIDSLREATRLDWITMVEQAKSREDRVAIRKAIAQRDIDLLELVERRWSLIQGR